MKKYILLLLMLALLGCGAGDATQAAQATTASYFQALAVKDWDKALECYASAQMTEDNKAKQVKMLENLIAKLGDYQSHSLVSYRYMTGSSTTTTLVYTVRYAKGTARETFIFKGSPNDQGYQFTGHTIESPVLLKATQ